MLFTDLVVEETKEFFKGVKAPTKSWPPISSVSGTDMDALSLHVCLCEDTTALGLGYIDMTMLYYKDKDIL